MVSNTVLYLSSSRERGHAWGTDTPSIPYAPSTHHGSHRHTDYRDMLKVLQ
jgi:hypothetical protein